MANSGRERGDRKKMSEERCPFCGEGDDFWLGWDDKTNENVCDTCGGRWKNE